MALSDDDLRYRAKCIRCGDALGDWALQLPKRERVCTGCTKKKFNKVIKSYARCPKCGEQVLGSQDALCQNCI